MTIFNNACGSLEGWGLKFIVLDRQGRGVAAFADPHDATQFIKRKAT